MAPDGHQARFALLHHEVALPWRAAGIEPRLTAAERGVTGEGQLSRRGEDAQAIVGVAVRRREQERRLRQVGPAGERCISSVERSSPQDDGHWIAEGDGGENIDLAETTRGHSGILPGAVPWPTTLSAVAGFPGRVCARESFRDESG